MSIFFRYIFPPLFGLLIYTSLRLVNDIISGTQFWKRHWSINAIEVASCIIVSYFFVFIIHYFVKKFSLQQPAKPTARMILKEFATVCFFCLLVLNLTVIPVAALTDDGLQLYDVVNINLIPLLYLLLYYAVLRGNASVKAFYEQQVQMEKLRNDQLDTELKFLKAQYHPHFLFNALNTIYFQMDEDVAAAKKSVEKFSDLLRYQLYDQQQTVAVSQEMEHLQNFVALQQVRSPEKLRLEMNISPSLNGQQVYPLLFLPLVENAFKYAGGEYIGITATGNEREILFEVKNSIPGLAIPGRAAGIGLQNLERRLELLYPGRHELKTGKTDNNMYIASLKLRL
ncbi:MAG TPA: histidine kinase [Chitinophagaceae bacterium]|nr:histidine kinase [Chitinophagaceae bacterium]